jgi:hypothetical protein
MSRYETINLRTLSNGLSQYGGMFWLVKKSECWNGMAQPMTQPLRVHRGDHRRDTPIKKMTNKMTKTDRT